MLRALKINARSISALMFAGYAATAAATAPAVAKPPLVLASIKPVYGLTAFLMRGAGTPTLLLEGNPYLRRTPLNVDENAF